MKKIQIFFFTIIALSCGCLSGVAQPILPTIPGRILNIWRFDTTNWLSGYGYAPLEYTNVSLVAGLSTNAAHLGGIDPAGLRYRIIESNGRTNLDLTRGTARFWFSPDWTSGIGSGGFGRLLEVGSATADASRGWWSLYFDPAGTNLLFSGQANGLTTNYLAAPISWASGEWHQIVLTWSATNSALYVDGSLLTTGWGVSLDPGTNAQAQTCLLIGGDISGTQLAQGSFDELRTYNYPLEAGFIASAYAQSGYATLIDWNLMNSISPPGGFEGGEGGEPGDVGYTPPSYIGITNLWIEILPPTNNVSVLVLHNTQSGLAYSILARTNIEGAAWSQWQDVVATNETNFIVTTTPTDELSRRFFKAMMNEDTDGDGLPDAFEVFINHTDPNNADSGNTGIPDGYKDDDWDGWTNLDEMRNGTNPLVFNTPAAPGNFTTQIVGTNVNLSWSPAAGPVLSYRIKKSGILIATVSSNTLTLQDGVDGDLLEPRSYYNQYTAIPQPDERKGWMIVFGPATRQG